MTCLISQKEVPQDHVFKIKYFYHTIIGLVWQCSLCNQIFIMTQKQYCVSQSECMIKVSLCFSFTSALNLNQEKTNFATKTTLMPFMLVYNHTVEILRYFKSINQKFAQAILKQMLTPIVVGLPCAYTFEYDRNYPSK